MTFYAFGVNEFLTWMLDAVQNVDPALRSTLAGIAIMLETSVLVGLIVPGDSIVIVSGTAVGSIAEAFILGAAVVVGALLGESFGFWLGRLLGPKIHHSWIGRRIGERNWKKSERYLERRGGPAIFLSRFLPVLHSLVPLTVGMSGYSYRKFLAWTAPACVAWSALYIGVAAVAAETYRELADQLHTAGYIFVAAIVIFIGLVFAAKKLIHHTERRHFDEDTEQLAEVQTEPNVED